MVIRLDLQSERVTPFRKHLPDQDFLNSLGRQDIPLHELILRGLFRTVGMRV